MKLDLMKKDKSITDSSEFPLPKVNMPSIEVPKFETPKLDFPSSFLPKMEMKMFEAPNLNLPLDNSEEAQLPKLPMNLPEMYKSKLPKPISDELEKSFPGGLPPAFLLGTAAVATTGVAGVAAAIVNMQKKETDDFLFQPDANSNEGSKKGIPKINSKENMLSEAKMKEKRLRAEQEETRARPLAKQTAAQEKEMKASDKQSEDVFGRARTTTEEPATNKSRISAEVASSFGNSNSLSKDGASSKNNTQSKDTESSKVAFLSSSFKTTNSPLKSASPFGSKPTPKEGPSSKKGACQSSDSTDGNMAKSQQKKTMFPFGTTPKGASSFSSKVSPKEVATSTAESSKAAFSSSSIAASSKEASPSTDNTDKNIAKTPTKKTILPFGTTPKGASPFNGKVSPKEVAASTAESSKAAFSSSSIAASSKEASPSTDSTDKNIAKAPAKKTIFPFGTTPKGTSPFSGKMSPKEAAASTAESSNPAFSSSSSKNRNSAKAPAKKSIISSGTTPKAPLSLSGIALPKIAATSTTEPSKVAFSSSSSATSSSNEASPSSERKDGNIARAPFKTTKNPLKGASIFGNKQSPNEISSSKNVNAESQTQAKKKIDTFGTTKSTSSSPFSSTTSAPKSASPFGGIASPKEVAASTTKSSKVAFPFSTSAASSKGVLPSSQSKDRRIAKTPAKKTMLPFGTTPKGASPFSGKVSPKEVAASTTESPINEDLSPPESNDAEISKSVAKKTISPFGIKRASVSTVAVNTTSTSDNTGKGLSPPASKSVTRDEGERDRFAAMRIESLASTRVTESVAAARAASAASGKEPEEKSLSPPETTPPVFPSKNNMAEEAERVRLAAKRISESVAAARAESEAVQKASSETEPAEKSTTPFETTPTSALATPVNPSSSNSSIPDGLSKFASLAPSKPPPASNSDITEEAEAERLAAKKITESVAAARAAAEAAQKAASSEEGVNMKTEEDPIVKPTSPETNAQKTAADEEVASERERLAAKQICESVAAARAAAEAAQKAASSEEGVHMKTEEDPSVKLTSPETNVQKTAVDEEVASDIAEEAETERLAAKKIAESVAAARAAAEAAQKAASSEEGVKMKTKEDPCVKPTAPKTNTQKAAADEEVAKETIEKAENKSSNTETAAYEEAKKRVEKEIEEIAARAAEKKKDDAIEKAAFSRDIESEAKKESFPFESSKSQNEVNGSSEPARKEEVSSKGFTPKEFSHSPVNPNSTFPSDSTKVADVTICDSPAKNTFSPFGSASSEPPPPSLESSPSPKRNDVSSSPSFKPKGTSSFDDNGSSGSPAKKAFSFKKTSTPFRSDPLGSSSPVSKSSEKKEFSPKAFSPFGSDPPSSSRLPFKPKSGSPFENSASPKEVNGSNGTADQKSAKKKELLPKPFTPFGSGPPGFSDTPFKPIDGSPFENSKPPKETKESVASSEKQAFTPFGKPQPSDSSSPFTPNVSARFAALNKTKSFSSTEEGSKNVNETEPMEDTPKETRSKQ